MTAMEELKNIASKFAIKGSVVDIKPLGSGLINDTFFVKADSGEDYVLQKINTAIFKDPELLQSNIVAVTDHLRKKLSGDPEVGRKVLKFLQVKDGGKTWLQDGDGGCWRMSVYIRDSYTHDTVNPEYSYYAGRAFGEFESMLSDLDAPLGETIPDFHNMELRARQLQEAISADAAGRLSNPEVQALLDEMLPLSGPMCKAEALYNQGLLPKRICHCDTKVNNILFDADGNILCVIDLDTVMPGFVFSDFGDFMRTAANNAAEDEPDTSKVSFNMDIYKAFTKGYLETATFLTPVEIEHLPYAALRFAYMQAVRFLADYINGDTYYKIANPEHNLVRTKAQMALYRSIESHYSEMMDYLNIK